MAAAVDKQCWQVLWGKLGGIIAEVAVLACCSLRADACCGNTPVAPRAGRRQNLCAGIWPRDVWQIEEIWGAHAALLVDGVVEDDGGALLLADDANCGGGPAMNRRRDKGDMQVVQAQGCCQLVSAAESQFSSQTNKHAAE